MAERPFDYWPIRQDSRDRRRICRSFRWGKAAEIFILDTRQYRDIDEGTMLGSEQKQWLLEALSSS
ncbi:MAG: alkaline phosphatase D family protein [Deltaproteobacteria bacterium]|nr:alkaline phosphatase D family protein [Deltaproteobacteria bacterium]